jgi:hypothetical protein
MIFVCEAKTRHVNNEEPHNELLDYNGTVTVLINAKTFNEAKTKFESMLYYMFEKNEDCRKYVMTKIAKDD